MMKKDIQIEIAAYAEGRNTVEKPLEVMKYGMVKIQKHAAEKIQKRVVVKRLASSQEI